MTPRPDLGSVAEELYSRLAQFHAHTLDGREVTDEELGWQLLIFWGSVARRWQYVEDLSRPGDGSEGWSPLVDIERIPDGTGPLDEGNGLPFLSQFKGVTLLPGMTPDQQRERIHNTDGFVRCTSDAIEFAAKRHLTGTRTVYINEREGGLAKHIGVVTYTTETPDPTVTFNDIIEQKPWGYIVDFQVVDEWGYQALKIAFDDYGEIKLHYPDYHGVKVNVPPAP